MQIALRAGKGPWELVKNPALPDREWWTRKIGHYLRAEQIVREAQQKASERQAKAAQAKSSAKRR